MVRVADILNDLGLNYTSVGKDHVVNCWHHEEKKPSMHIDQESGVFHCFSCKRSGNIFTIINQHLDITGIEALQYLGKFYSNKEDSAEKRIRLFKEGTIDPRNKNKVLHRHFIELPKYTHLRFHPYLVKRGLTVAEIQQWKMGVLDYNQPIEKFQGYGGWILIPIYQNNKLRNYFMRSPYSSRKLYGSYSIKNILFGYDQADDFSKPVYVVEGIFDMIMLRRTGVQVVASLTNRLYEEQCRLLKQYSKIVIVPDNDAPGLKLVIDALPFVNKNIPVGVCTVPYGKKDTGDCNTDELYRVIASEIDIVDYVTEMYYVSKFGNVNR